MMKYGSYYAMALSLVSGILISFTEYWYLIFVPLFIISMVFANTKKFSLLLGVLGAFGILLQIFAYNGNYRLKEAALIGNVAGIPGGAIIFLAFTFLLGFLLSFLGALAGYSVSPAIQPLIEKHQHKPAEKE